MNSRRFLFVALGLILVALVWWLLPRATPVVPATPAVAPTAASPTVVTKSENQPPEIENPQPVSLALDLNSPRFDITHDLVLLNDVFTSWRLDFPRTGNPYGENSDITAALTGDNPLRLSYIPRTHPAINAAGELCDRWGTPFRFHALAGDRMELRSAGPDKKFGTPDDALLTPP